MEGMKEGERKRGKEIEIDDTISHVVSPNHFSSVEAKWKMR